MRKYNIKRHSKSYYTRVILVTVDVGMSKHTGYIRFPDGSEVKPFDFYNNQQGFKYLWHRIEEARQTHGIQEVVVGSESTGSYGEPLVHYLNTKGVTLVQVNPSHTKRVKELEDNSPGKTDHKDPRVIADIIQFGHGLSVIIPEGAAAQLRRLTQARERCIKRLTILNNQLRDLVFIMFPEFPDVMKGVDNKTSRYLLTHYCTPRDIMDKGVSELSEIMRKVSRGKLGKERAGELYAAACRTVGITEGIESIVFEIKGIVSFINRWEQYISDLEAEMKRQLEHIAYSRNILSIRGIGVVTAAGLIGEVGDFKRFNTVAEVTKLSGYNLYEISSGKRQGRRRISKRGRPLLRKLLYYASVNTVRKDGVMHLYYKNYRSRMPKTKALVAVARKLLRIIFAIVRDNSTYKENTARLMQLQEVA